MSPARPIVAVFDRRSALHDRTSETMLVGNGMQAVGDETPVDLVEAGAASLREPTLANLARLAAQILAIRSSSRSKA